MIVAAKWKTSTPSTNHLLAFLLTKLPKLLGIAANGSYIIPELAAGHYTLTVFTPGFLKQVKKIHITDHNIVQNFELQSDHKVLNEVVISKKQDDIFNIETLKAIEGTAIYEGKKTELIVMDKIAANTATNNARQIFAKVPGVIVWESDCGGLQLGIATGEHRDLRIVLAGTDRHAGARYRRRGAHGCRGRHQARIDQKRVETALRAVEFADRRGAKTLGEAGAQQQVFGHLPTQAVLRRELATDAARRPKPHPLDALFDRITDRRQPPAEVRAVTRLLLHLPHGRSRFGLSGIDLALGQ